MKFTAVMQKNTKNQGTGDTEKVASTVKSYHVIP